MKRKKRQERPPRALDPKDELGPLANRAWNLAGELQREGYNTTEMLVISQVLSTSCVRAACIGNGIMQESDLVKLQQFGAHLAQGLMDQFHLPLGITLMVLGLAMLEGAQAIYEERAAMQGDMMAYIKEEDGEAQAAGQPAGTHE